jgi:hypothetical protein
MRNDEKRAISRTSCLPGTATSSALKKRGVGPQVLRCSQTPARQRSICGAISAGTERHMEAMGWGIELLYQLSRQTGIFSRYDKNNQIDSDFHAILNCQNQEHL